MDAPLRIGLVGAGSRANRYYRAVLGELTRTGAVQVVSVYNRTLSKAEALAASFGCPAATDLDAFLAAKPQAAVIVVAATAKRALEERALAAGLHVFTETPVSRTIKEFDSLRALASVRKLVVEVAEEQAFRPEAQLHAAIVRSGALGKVLSVHNEYAEYYYHACARLHMLFGHLPEEAAYHASNTRLNDGTQVEHREMAFRTGARYFQLFCNPSRHPLRTAPQWKVNCENGLLTDHGVWLKTPHDISEHTPFQWSGDHVVDGVQARIHRVSVSINGREFAWDAPVNNPTFTRAHHGIFHLLNAFVLAVRGKGALAYGLERAGRDVRLWRSMELAAKVPLRRVPAALAHRVSRILG